MFLCLSFIVRLMFVFLFCMSCLLLCVLCVFVLFCVCLLMYIVVFYLFICVQVYGSLPPGDNPNAVNKYHIIQKNSAKRKHSRKPSRWQCVNFCRWKNMYWGIGWTIFTAENRNTRVRGGTVPVTLRPPQIALKWSGIEPKLPRWEAGD
jgi:hypothetical protein